MSSISSSVLAGMHMAEARLEQAAGRIAQAFVVPDPQADAPSMPVDVIDVSTAMVELMQAKAGMAAAVKVSHAEQEMQSRVLDLLA